MNEQAKARRYLHVGDVAIPLRDEDVPALYSRRIVYDCGAGNHEPPHDLHIDPDSYSWSLEGIEMLVLAIARGIEFACDQKAQFDVSGQAGAIA